MMKQNYFSSLSLSLSLSLIVMFEEEEEKGCPKSSESR